MHPFASVALAILLSALAMTAIVGVRYLIVSGEIAWCIAPTEDGVRARIGETVALVPGEARPIWRFTYQRRSPDA